MNKYHVYLADNYTSVEPFITDWDYELIGDKLRSEFDEYFEKQQERAGAGAGKSKNLFKGEYVKKFMVSERINLVGDPVTQGLKSVFVLKIGEKKVIDKRAKDNLATRFEYKDRKDREGKKLDPLGFMSFDLIEGSEEKGSKKGLSSLQVGGNDIEYFQEEPIEIKEETEKFVCEVCEKEFDTKKQLQGHKLSHTRK